MDLAERMHEDFERALWKQTAHLTKVAFSPSPLPGFYQEFRDTMASIATAGGGEFIPLTDEKQLTKQIIVPDLWHALGNGDGTLPARPELN